MDATWLYYALSTIAQCAAALATLVGFLGLWRLNRLRDEAAQLEGRLAELMPRERIQREGALISRVALFNEARYIANDRRSGRSSREIFLSISITGMLDRWDVLFNEQRRLKRPLLGFLSVALLMLVLSITGLVFIPELLGWKGTRGLIVAASVCLGMGPAYVIYQASRSVAPLEPALLLYLVDKRKDDVTQIILARLEREYEQHPPADNPPVESP